MREIEVKARIIDSNSLKKQLQELGVTMSAPLKQHDVVYSRPGAIDNDPTEVWLRVRTENDERVIFTLKRSVTGDLDSIEHEVVVDDAKEVTAIIKQLGYELYSDLTKIRQNGKYQDIEICIDELPKLGTYVELEKLCADDADAKVVTESLWQVLETFGIDRSAAETSGYDILMRKAGL